MSDSKLAVVCELDDDLTVCDAELQLLLELLPELVKDLVQGQDKHED